MKTIVQVEIEVDKDGSVGVGVLGGVGSSMLAEMIEEGVMEVLRNIKEEDLKKMMI